jgi:hypothetical protein
MAFALPSQDWITMFVKNVDTNGKVCSQCVLSVVAFKLNTILFESIKEKLIIVFPHIIYKVVIAIIFFYGIYIFSLKPLVFNQTLQMDFF